MTRKAALLLALLAPLPLLAQDAGGDASEASALYGVTVDRESGVPLAGVSVTLTSPALRAALALTSAADGSFAFPSLPAGDYALRLTRIGYRPLVYEVALAEHTRVDVRIELSSEAIELDPVVVETRRPDFLARRGFYERQQRGLGRFITRDDIEARDPLQISDLLRPIPSVNVTGGGISGGGVVTMRRGCTPSIYLDGMRMAPPVALNDVLTVESVEAIEVYRDVETPVQFRSNLIGCGSIVIWTRRGGPDDGRAFSWRRMFVAAGFVLGVFLLTQ